MLNNKQVLNQSLFVTTGASRFGARASHTSFKCAQSSSTFSRVGVAGDAGSRRAAGIANFSTVTRAAQQPPRPVFMSSAASNEA